MFKKILKWAGIVVAVVLLGLGGYVGYQVSQYEAAMAKTYDIPLPKIERSTDPEVIARGKHLAESMAGCAIHDCHGSDLAGGPVMDIGPLGSIQSPNITSAGRLAQYSDGELARLILHGVRRDGKSVTFMPVQDFSWLPDDEVQALISYLRSVPPVKKPDGEVKVGLLGKVLDRRNEFIIDVAGRIDHVTRPKAPTPAPTAAYGAYVARLCQGCHGEGMSGGPIPGAPPSIPVPLNLTQHETGLKGWGFEQFDQFLSTGMKKNGEKVNPFMPLEALAKMNEVERRALWAHLERLPPTPFGQR